MVAPLIEGSIFFLFWHSAMHVGSSVLLLIFTSSPPMASPVANVGQVPPGGGGLTKEDVSRFYIENCLLLVLFVLNLIQFNHNLN